MWLFVMQSSISRNSGDADYEGLYISAPQQPEDILCEGSDTECSPQEVERKRLRYEYNARRYLQGHAPILQSASLRGPLGDGWINPWRYRPRRKEEWWKPGTEDVLFTRENVMKRAADHGNGHLTPVEALAWCKAKAKKEAHSRDNISRERLHNGDSTEINVAEDAEDVEEMEYVQSCSVQQISTMGLDSQPIPPAASCEFSTMARGYHDDDDDDDYHQASMKSLFGGGKSLKRLAETQWLKGSYASKRARWESPASTASPTPKSWFNARKEVRSGCNNSVVQRTIDGSKKSLLSEHIPVVPTNYSNTPGTTGSQDIQRNDSDHYGGHNEQQERQRLPVIPADDLDISPAPANPNINATPAALYHELDTPATKMPNTSSNSSPNSAGSLSLPQLSKSPGAIEDTSFVTEIAPSSRNLEKFQFKKKRRRTNRTSAAADKGFHVIHAASEYIAATTKELSDLQKADSEFGSLMVDDVSKYSFPPDELLSSIPSFYDKHVEYEPAPQSKFSESTPKSTKSEPHMDERSSEPISPVSHEYDIRRRLEDKPALFLASKTPVKKPSLPFSLGAPVQLSPLNMCFSSGTRAAILRTMNGLESPLHTTKEDDTVEKYRSAILMDATPRRSLVKPSTDSGIQTQRITELSPVKYGDFTPVNNRPAKFMPAKSLRRSHENDKFTPHTGVPEGSLQSVYTSPRLSTPRKPSPHHRVPSVLKTLYGGPLRDDDSTQSWNSTEPGFINPPSQPPVEIQNKHQQKAQDQRPPEISYEILKLKINLNNGSQNSSDVENQSSQISYANIDIVDKSDDKIEVYRVGDDDRNLPPQHSGNDTNGKALEIVFNGEPVSPDSENDSGNKIEAAEVVVYDSIQSSAVLEESSRHGCHTSSPQSPWTTVEVAPIPATTTSMRISSGSFEVIETEDILVQHKPAKDVKDDKDGIFGWQGEDIPTVRNDEKQMRENDSGWQPEIIPSQVEISKHSSGEANLAWEPLERPATPSGDEIRPFREFMTPTPSPKRSRLRASQDQLPNTQQIIEAATLNPWTSAFKKPSRKSGKRVSFGLLPLEHLEGSHGDDSPVSRKLSPPPIHYMNLSDEDESTGLGKATRKGFESHFLAPDGVAGYRPKMRDSPLKWLASPAVSGMAEAFIAADRETSMAEEQPLSNNGTSSRQSQPFRKFSVELNKDWDSSDESRSHAKLTPTASSLRTIDYKIDAGDNLDDFLCEGGILEDWSVETELKKTRASNSESLQMQKSMLGFSHSAGVGGW
jgi:hypothetical protein